MWARGAPTQGHQAFLGNAGSYKCLGKRESSCSLKGLSHQIFGAFFARAVWGLAKNRCLYFLIGQRLLELEFNKYYFWCSPSEKQKNLQNYVTCLSHTVVSFCAYWLDSFSFQHSTVDSTVLVIIKFKSLNLRQNPAEIHDLLVIEQSYSNCR